MTNNYYSLSQIAEHLQKLITKTYIREYWIKAEISALNFYPKSGHCYPDLVEKSEFGVKAQIRGIIWRGAYIQIQDKFKTTTGRQLEDGMEILFRARLDYSPTHGLSLNITDIDPHFTLGKMAADKLQCVNKLKDDGIFFSNKVLITPFFPKRIAIISVETSKGFHDFKNIIDNNSRGYKFFYMLFPALLQGDEAVDSISKQLERIRKVKHHFDLVAIIRGGGGDVGLSCYNNYNLARLIATFPIPVFSGIGHSTNETVVEMVAHKNAITPTDLAYFLQQKFDNLAVQTDEFRNSIQIQTIEILKAKENQLHRLGERVINRQGVFLSNQSEMIKNQQNRLIKYSQKFIPIRLENIKQKSIKLANLPTNRIERNLEILKYMKSAILKSANHDIKIHWQKTHHQEEKIKILNPIEVLKKGFSITRINGKAITNTKNFKIGDLIETETAKGKIESKILKTK